MEKPRAVDIPELHPLEWNIKAGATKVNDLHQVIADVLEAMTGNPKPSEPDLLEYIQIHYQQVFLTKKKLLERFFTISTSNESISGYECAY